MATVDPRDARPAGGAPGAAAPPEGEGRSAPPEGAHEKRRNWWMWACAVLAVVAVGLGVWALDRDAAAEDSQQQVADLQAQAEQTEDTGSAVVAAFKSAYDGLKQQLGSTNEDLEATQQDVAEAQDAADQAEQDAAAAKQRAEQAKDETEQTRAQADEAKAEAEAAKSNATVVMDCAKAYLGAFGALFEGDSVRAQAATVKQDLQRISADCKGALGGA